jgi:hypothetical protein
VCLKSDSKLSFLSGWMSKERRLFLEVVLGTIYPESRRIEKRIRCFRAEILEGSCIISD